MVAIAPVRIGTGEHKVLALHGWFGSATGWGWLPEVLDGDRFEWAFPDCRGYGTRRDVAGTYTIAEIAADVVAAADELGWDRFSLVGHSMGGSAVQRVLVEVPDRVRSLVGVSPVPASGVPFDEDAWALFAGAAGNDGNRRAIIDLTTGNRLSGAWLDRMVAFSVRESTREAFGAYLLAWAKTDFSARLDGIGVPVKVIVGDHDPALGAATMEQTVLRHLPDADLEVLSNAGHYAMFETPVALVTSIEEFLSR